MRILIAALLAVLAPAAAFAADFPTCVSVTTAATEVLPAVKAPRARLLCQNIGSTNDAFCKVGGATVTATTGFRLEENGGSWSESAQIAVGGRVAGLPSEAVSCITSSSTTPVCCSEQ